MIAPLSRIAGAVNGRLIPTHDGSVQAHGVSTDSRSTQSGDLFVPLRGANFDGHDFIPAAVERGACAVLCEKPLPQVATPQIVVDDTLKALGDLAAFWRRQFQVPVAAVTGSSGKTTTKEMLAAILSVRSSGLKTAGNFNNLIGLPLTVFNFTEAHQWAVLELGMSARGEILRLTEIAAPTVGIVTNVAPAHLLTLRDIDGVARAKGELFAALQADAVAVINHDDPYVTSMPVANGVRKILYGLEGGAEFTAKAISVTPGVTRFILVTPQGEREIVLNIAGRHNVCNALAAAAAALEMGADLDSVKTGLESFQGVGGRLEMIKLRDDIVLLRDIYNANPLSVRAALETLDETPGRGRRIAVLGDMLELGEASQRLHREIGAYAAQRCDLLFLYGVEAREIGNGAIAAGMSEGKIRTAATHAELADQIFATLRSGDRILIKGSRGMKMEMIATPLLETLTPEAGDN